MKSHRRLRGHSATMIKQAREGGPCSRLSMQNWDRWFFVSMMVVSKLSVLGTDLERSWSWGRVVYCYKSNASNRSTKGNPTWELYKSIPLAHTSVVMNIMPHSITYLCESQVELLYRLPELWVDSFDDLRGPTVGGQLVLEVSDHLFQPAQR